MNTQLPNTQSEPQLNTDVDDAQVALQLGERALAQLALQARAVQIEARKAELELVMEQAHRGDLEPLQRWLRVHNQHSRHVQNEAPETPTPKQSSEACLVEPRPEVNWELYRKIAAERLRHRRPFTANSSQQAQPEKRQEVRGLEVDELEDKFVAVSADELQEGASQDTSSHSAETQEAEVTQPASLSSELLAELKLDEKILAEGTNVVRRGRWRGAVISAAFHVLLLIVLAAMTLDTPVKDGLLSLVASESSSAAEVDSFELTQELEVQEPVSEPVEATSPTTQPNLSDALPSLNESLSDALGQTAANSTSDSKSTMMAAKASSSKEMVSFYGAESSGNSFCFVLDGSGSMKGGPWEAARIELLRSIGSLKPNQKFYIIFFNKEVMAITEPGEARPARSPLYATPENIAHAKRWLDTLQVKAGEPPMKAMEAALQVECDCIYYLADGEMTDSIAKRLLETLRKLNRTNDIIDGEVVLIPIHTIAYYSDKGLETMRKIAEENRGQFAYVPKPKTSRKN